MFFIETTIPTTRGIIIKEAPDPAQGVIFEGCFFDKKGSVPKFTLPIPCAAKILWALLHGEEKKWNGLFQKWGILFPDDSLNECAIGFGKIEIPKRIVVRRDKFQAALDGTLRNIHFQRWLKEQELVAECSK